MLDGAVKTKTQGGIRSLTHPGSSNALPEGADTFFTGNDLDGAANAEGFIVTSTVGTIARYLKASLNDINRMAAVLFQKVVVE